MSGCLARDRSQSYMLGDSSVTAQRSITPLKLEVGSMIQSLSPIDNALTGHPRDRRDHALLYVLY